VLWLWSQPALFSLTLLEAHAVHDAHALTPELLDGYIRANLSDPHRRHKTRRFLAGQLDPAHSRVTLDLVPGLRRFDHPALLLWARTIRTSGRNGRSGCAATSRAPLESSSYHAPDIC
jgi:hypothetical protein